MYVQPWDRHLLYAKRRLEGNDRQEIVRWAVDKISGMDEVDIRHEGDHHDKLKINNLLKSIPRLPNSDEISDSLCHLYSDTQSDAEQSGNLIETLQLPSQLEGQTYNLSLNLSDTHWQTNGHQNREQESGAREGK